MSNDDIAHGPCGYLVIGVPRGTAADPDAPCGLVTHWFETREAALAAAQAFAGRTPGYQAYVVKSEANFLNVATPG